jgi:hypothetical protein
MVSSTGKGEKKNSFEQAEKLDHNRSIFHTGTRAATNRSARGNLPTKWILESES